MKYRRVIPTSKQGPKLINSAIKRHFGFAGPSDSVQAFWKNKIISLPTYPHLAWQGRDWGNKQYFNLGLTNNI